MSWLNAGQRPPPPPRSGQRGMAQERWIWFPLVMRVSGFTQHHRRSSPLIAAHRIWLKPTVGHFFFSLSSFTFCTFWQHGRGYTTGLRRETAPRASVFTFSIIVIQSKNCLPTHGSASAHRDRVDCKSRRMRGDEWWWIRHAAWDLAVIVIYR